MFGYFITDKVIYVLCKIKLALFSIIFSYNIIHMILYKCFAVKWILESNQGKMSHAKARRNKTRPIQSPM
jgi:hypothetical protein